MRINAQLIDARTGGHLWAERYDGAMTDVFALQDRITGAIVRSLQVTLSVGEQARLSRKPTEDQVAYELYLKARAAFLRFDKDGLHTALTLYREARTRDPRFAAAHAGEAIAARLIYSFGYYTATLSLADARERAKDAAAQALAVDPDNAVALGVQAAMVQLRTADHGRAIGLAKRAVAAEPNNAVAYRFLAGRFIRADRPTDALQAIETAIRLAPRPLPLTAAIFGRVLVDAGAPARGVAYLEQARSTLAESPWVRLTLARGYALLGRREDAKAEMTAYLKLMNDSPGENVQQHAVWSQYYAKDAHQHYLDSLRLTGMPEWPFGFEGNPENQLDGAKIQALMFGHTRIGKQNDGRTKYELNLSENGESYYRTNMGFSMRGQMWVDDNVLCYKYKKLADGRTFCGSVFRNPDGSYDDRNEYVFAHPGALSWFSIKR